MYLSEKYVTLNDFQSNSLIQGCHIPKVSSSSASQTTDTFGLVGRVVTSSVLATVVSAVSAVGGGVGCGCAVKGCAVDEGSVRSGCAVEGSGCVRVVTVVSTVTSDGGVGAVDTRGVDGGRMSPE